MQLRVSWTYKFMLIITLILIISLVPDNVYFLVRYPGGRYDRFPAVYVPNFLKTRQRRNNTEPVEAKQLPLVKQYDGNPHDFIANLRRIDGSLPPHVKYRPLAPVNICRGLMVKASGWQSFDRQFDPYPRAIKVAPLWCSLGCRSESDGRIHQ